MCSVLTAVSEKDKYSKIWKCEFCEHVNKIMIDPEEIPKTSAVTYVKERGVVAQKQAALPMIIFCIGM